MNAFKQDDIKNLKPIADNNSENKNKGHNKIGSANNIKKNR